MAIRTAYISTGNVLDYFECNQYGMHVHSTYPPTSHPDGKAHTSCQTPKHDQIFIHMCTNMRNAKQIQKF